MSGKPAKTRPGTPPGSGDPAQPLAVLFDLLGRPTALCVFQSLAQEPGTIDDLQARCGPDATAVLAKRLQELRAAGLVAEHSGRYGLTDTGRALLAALEPLGDWAQSWAAATPR